MNSFRAIARAIESERKRQIEVLEDGGKVIQQPAAGTTMREKARPCVQKRMPRITVIS